MMDGKWTPGPWYHHAGEIRAEEAWYEKICTMPIWGPYQDDPDLSSKIEAETNANAALIASAPDMAERIAELEAELEQTNKMIAVQIRADEAWGRLERAEIWKMRLAANEQALAGAEGEAEHK